MRSFELARKIIEVESVNEKGERIIERKVAIDDAGNEILAYEDAQLPMYMTTYAAGADFFAAQDTVVPSIWKQVLICIRGKVSMTARTLCDKVAKELGYTPTEKEKKIMDILPTFVHTGIKSNMEDDEVLEIYNRSSNPKKVGLVLANSVGVIDKDFYNNKDNDGEIMFAFYNFKLWDVTIKKGDRIGQGVFKKVLRPTVGLRVKEVTREGGFGSTNKTE